MTAVVMLLLQSGVQAPSPVNDLHQWTRGSVVRSEACVCMVVGAYRLRGGGRGSAAKVVSSLEQLATKARERLKGSSAEEVAGLESSDVVEAPDQRC